MTPDEWRKRVGRHVEKRRTDLHLSVRAASKAAGVSEGLWRTVESGERRPTKGVIETVNPKPETRSKIARSLGWPRGSINELANGRPPEDVLDLAQMAWADYSEFVAHKLPGVLDDAISEPAARSLLSAANELHQMYSAVARPDDRRPPAAAHLELERRVGSLSPSADDEPAGPGRVERLEQAVLALARAQVVLLRGAVAEALVEQSELDELQRSLDEAGLEDRSAQ